MRTEGTINNVALCAGVGMLDEGLRAGVRYLGGELRTVVYVERDAYAAATLVARMADQAVGEAPIWDDLTTFDGGAWRGSVDCLSAGFPCQPWSSAGKQQGTDDERWLWPAITRIIRDAQPSLVFLENVPGLVSGGGLHLVLDDLAEMGFDAEWCHIQAGAVGASHRRERVFILANAQHGARCTEWFAKSWQRGTAGPDYGAVPGEAGRELADTECRGRGEMQQPSQGGRPDVTGLGEALGNAIGTRADARPARRGPRVAACEPSRPVGNTPGAGGRLLSGSDGRQGCEGPNQIRSRRVRGQQRPPVDEQPELSDAEVGHAERTGPQGNGSAESEWRDESVASNRDWGVFAPGPSDGRWGEIAHDGPHLAPAVEPGFRVLVDGLALVVDESRADQLRCGGNGVVALQAATAFVVLARRLIGTKETQ